MSKAHRGKNLKIEHPNCRIECPLCKRTGIKAIYEIKAGEKAVKVCKECSKAVKNGKKQDELTTLAS